MTPLHNCTSSKPIIHPKSISTDICADLTQCKILLKSVYQSLRLNIRSEKSQKEINLN